MTDPDHGIVSRPPEELIAFRGVTKVYGRGDASMQALRGIDLDIDAGRVRGDHGTERLGQIDLHEHPRLPRHADLRELSLQGDRGRQPDPQPARPAAPPLSGVRLSGLQPPEPHLGAGERGAASGLSRRLRRRATGARPRGPGDGRSDGVGIPYARRALRRTAAAGRDRPRHRHRAHRSCWPTSRRAISTRPAAGRSWSC